MPICSVAPAYWLTGRSFVIAAYIRVRLWPTHQLVGVAKKSLLIRRDTTLRIACLIGR